MNRTKSTNAIEIDFSEPSILRDIMHEYGDTEQMFFGKNQCGEDQDISISHECIILRTYQSNHWVRVNVFDEDGYLSCETFDGRWN